MPRARSAVILRSPVPVRGRARNGGGSQQSRGQNNREISTSFHETAPPSDGKLSNNDSFRTQRQSSAVRTRRRRIAAVRRQGTRSVVQSEARTNTCLPGSTVSKRLAAACRLLSDQFCLNPRLVMRLLPMKDPDRSWRSIKGQWKKDAESVGEDFSTFSTGSFLRLRRPHQGRRQPQPVLPFRRRAGSRGLPGQPPDDEQVPDRPSCARASSWCRRSTNWVSRTPANTPR